MSMFGDDDSLRQRFRILSSLPGA